MTDNTGLYPTGYTPTDSDTTYYATSGDASPELIDAIRAVATIHDEEPYDRSGVPKTLRLITYPASGDAADRWAVWGTDITTGEHSMKLHGADEDAARARYLEELSTWYIANTTNERATATTRRHRNEHETDTTLETHEDLERLPAGKVIDDQGLLAIKTGTGTFLYLADGQHWEPGLPAELAQAIA
ncbi:hypothetical protein [Nocardia asiatica]|uniref:hypothetical protein n=1 Tax=Nocardia asiatica TaxID=209252 RepID=UPI0002E2E057|nr:hypothetical protein [Nocardia asiatica]